MHEEAPAALYFPKSQAVQVIAIPPLNVPAAQVAQEEDPAAADVPARQDVQLVAFAMLNFPPSQLVQLADPADEVNFPAEQSEHPMLELTK